MDAFIYNSPSIRLGIDVGPRPESLVAAAVARALRDALGSLEGARDRRTSRVELYQARKRLLVLEALAVMLLHEEVR